MRRLFLFATIIPLAIFAGGVQVDKVMLNPVATPATPASGAVIYAKSDGKPYVLPSTGTESMLVESPVTVADVSGLTSALSGKASTTHAATHASGGSDPVTPASIGADSAGAASAVSASLSAHESLTTTAHGGIVASTDSRLTDARTPTAHHTTHGTGGTDAIAPADIGAAASSHTHTASAINDSTTAGRSLLTAADASAQRTALGLGTAATASTGTSAGNVVALDGSARLPAVDGSALINLPSGGGSTVHYQEFTADGTWTKPSGVTMVYVEAIGGGGSGSPGTYNLSATAPGGPSGSSGVFSSRLITASIVGATVSVTIGLGGPAVAPSPSASIGVAGNAGGSSYFGSIVSAVGGSASSNGTLAPSNIFTMSPMYCAVGVSSTSAGTRSAFGPGGGGGGGVVNAITPGNGGAGGIFQQGQSWSTTVSTGGATGGTAGVAGGTVGGDGGNGGDYEGGGGGGAAYNSAGVATGGNGGAGGYPGGGGGGGGGARGTVSSSRGGYGGAGGNGRVRVWAW